MYSNGMRKRGPPAQTVLKTAGNVGKEPFAGFGAVR